MDRPIPRKPRWFHRAIWGFAALALGGVVWLALQSKGQTLRLEADTVLVTAVSEGTFQPYVSVLAQAEPEESVRLDAVVAGRVEEVLVRDGATVSKGTPLARLANPDLRLRVLGAESERAAQRDRLTQQRMASEGSVLATQSSLLDAEHAAREAEDGLRRTEMLRESGAVSDQELEAARRAAEHARGQLGIAQATVESARSSAAQQGAQVQRELGAIDRSAAVTRSFLNDLIVRAPTEGRLSGFDLQVGMLVQAGTTLGFIDRMGDARVIASLDEHYLPQIREGMRARAEIDGEERSLSVVRVFPDVKEGRFEVEFAFDGTTPDLRKGQGIRLRVELGEPRQSLLLPRGAYLDAASGRGLFVITPDGSAERRTVRLGEQNPETVEVVSGLHTGERVVTSDYERFGNADRLDIRR